MKKDTLKIIRKINMDSSNCDDIDSCDSLENLSLCKNLVEFFGSLHEHELVHLAGLENLQKLKLYQGCRIPGSGGAQAPPVFRTLSHKNAIKPENLRF